MNWKNFVAQQNAKVFTLPPGWDSRESIAEQLECSPEKVREHLQPGITARTIESRGFPVWDGQLSRKTMVTAYRRIDPESLCTTSPDPITGKSPRKGAMTASDEALALEMRQKGASLSQIGIALGRSKTSTQEWFANRGPQS